MHTFQNVLTIALRHHNYHVRVLTGHGSLFLVLLSILDGVGQQKKKLHKLMR